MEKRRTVMSKISKFFVKLYFGIWLLCSVLPMTIAEYRAFDLLFKVEGYLFNGVIVLSIIIFILAFIPVKQKPVAESEKTTLILHDLEPEVAREIFGDTNGVKLFCTLDKMAACKGYYDCWLRTPGICALRDGFEDLGRQIASCDKFVIVSKNLYGGFNREIKNALDRSISFALPFFRFHKREIHHQARFDKIGNMTVYIYDSDSITDFDKNSIKEMSKAVSFNANKNEPHVLFVNKINDLKELTP